MSGVDTSLSTDTSCFQMVKRNTKFACRQMSRMHSPRTQCCCCAGNIFFMLFGILMLSTGACLVLNYGQLEVDTGGLPPGLQNEEGKRVVGIILICCGFASMGVSALMGALYFTVCSRPKPPPRNTVMPNKPREPKSSRDPKPLSSSRKKGHGISVSDPSISSTAGNYSVAANQPRHSGMKHSKRSRKKRNNPSNLKHGMMYKNVLAPHAEHDEERGAKEEEETNDSVMSVDSSQTESTDTRKSSLEVDAKPPVIISMTSIEMKPSYLGSVPETSLFVRSRTEFIQVAQKTSSVQNVPSETSHLEPSPSGSEHSKTTGL